MLTPRQQKRTMSVDVAAWVGGGAVALAFITILLVGNTIAERAYHLMMLSTVAMIQGMAINRRRTGEASKDRQKSVERVIWLTAAAALLHCVALVLNSPISYVAWSLEAACFLVACYFFIMSDQ